MFRRTMGKNLDGASGVTIPASWKTYSKLILSTEEVLPGKAEETAQSRKGRIATLSEVLIDEKFLIGAKGNLFYVDWMGVPQQSGFYDIIRENHQLTLSPILPVHVFDNSPWHRTIYIGQGTIDASKAKRLLVLDTDKLSPGLTLRNSIDNIAVKLRW